MREMERGRDWVSARLIRSEEMWVCIPYGIRWRWATQVAKKSQIVHRICQIYFNYTCRLPVHWHSLLNSRNATQTTPDAVPTASTFYRKIRHVRQLYQVEGKKRRIWEVQTDWSDKMGHGSRCMQSGSSYSDPSKTLSKRGTCQLPGIMGCEQHLGYRKWLAVKMPNLNYKVTRPYHMHPNPNTVIGLICALLHSAPGMRKHRNLHLFR